jgi:hypothetical protein
MTAELQEELADARSLLYQIELALNADNITEAHFFAAELAETLYRANLIYLQEPAERECPK